MSHKCGQCGHYFPTHLALKMHLLMDHGRNDNPPSIAETIIILVIITIVTLLGGILL
jgi:hypothetical protein